MVAGGTGMAPIKAVLEHLAAQDRRPRTQVFVGGRTWEDLYDFPALRKLSYSNPWLDVIPVVETDDSESGAQRARSPTSSPATAPGPTTTCWSAVAVDDPGHRCRGCSSRARRWTGSATTRSRWTDRRSQVRRRSGRHTTRACSRFTGTRSRR
jgi:hypothetical protein